MLLSLHGPILEYKLCSISREKKCYWHLFKLSEQWLYIRWPKLSSIIINATPVKSAHRHFHPKLARFTAPGTSMVRCEMRYTPDCSFPVWQLKWAGGVQNHIEINSAILMEWCFMCFPPAAISIQVPTANKSKQSQILLVFEEADWFSSFMGMCDQESPNRCFL